MNEKNYTFKDVSDMPLKDFNDIFASGGKKKPKRAEQGALSPEQVLGMI